MKFVKVYFHYTNAMLWSIIEYEISIKRGINDIKYSMHIL